MNEKKNRRGENSVIFWKEKELQYLSNPNYCKECQGNLDWKHKNNKFCSSSCAAKFNNKNRVDKCPNKIGTKKVQCAGNCGSLIDVNVRCSLNKSKCESCFIKDCNGHFIKSKSGKLRKKKLCEVCGELFCQNKEVCKRKQLITGTLTKYFGYDISCFGSKEAIKEFYRIHDKIHDLYSTMSLQQICNLTGYPNSASNLWNTLKFFKIDYRSFSESNRKSILDGRDLTNWHSNQYKTGWHETWEGKKIFYRSSYELEYAIQLDEQKIKYDVEKVRIEYWDNQQLKYRIAIPDFYLPDYNEIVEIKSTWTYDEQNMRDKVLKYKELDYNFKLILNKVEYLEPVTI